MLFASAAGDAILARRTPLVREPLARVGALAVELLYDGSRRDPGDDVPVRRAQAAQHLSKKRSHISAPDH